MSKPRKKWRCSKSGKSHILCSVVAVTLRYPHAYTRGYPASREVLMDELAATNEQLHDKEVEELEAQLRKPPIEGVDPWATDDAGAATPMHGGHGSGDQEDAVAATSRAQPMSSPIRVLPPSARTTGRDDEQEAPVQLSMVPPFLGQRYEKGLKSTNKAANAIPFVAPETSRIVAGRWRKKNESLAEAVSRAHLCVCVCPGILWW